VRGGRPENSQAVQLPISFEKNVGHFPVDARYAARGSGYDFFLTSKEDVLIAGSVASPIRLRPLRSNSDAKPEGREYRNYLFGNNPSEWKTHVPHFGEMWYPRLYPGVDLSFTTETADTWNMTSWLPPPAKAEQIRYLVED
jgi:hypothetical protein